MPDEVVGEAFVRIRPLVSPSGFAAESEGAVASAGRRLGTVFAAAFAAVGVAELVKSVVTAAVDHQAAFAVLERTVKDAGASNVVYGQTIEHLLEQEARLKGFSDEELASAFQRLVSVTKDSGKAFTDLQHAEDLARFRHIDLATAALAISKALQGSTTALQRYGLVVPKVTAAEDALKLAHDRAIAANVKLSERDKELYAQRLLQAKAIDKQATEEKALALIQQRTGGTAATFAQTSAGQFARLGQDLHQFKVAIGTDLLPILTGAAEGLGSFLTKAAGSKTLMDEASTAAHDVGEAFHVTGDVIKGVAPVVEDVAQAFGGLTHVIEALGAVLLARGIASGLKGWFGPATVSETTSQAAAMQALTAAVTEQTAALTGYAAAATEAAAAGEGLATTAASTAAATIAAETAAGTSTVGAVGATAAVGGAGLATEATAEAAALDNLGRSSAALGTETAGAAAAVTVLTDSLGANTIAAETDAAALATLAEANGAAAAAAGAAAAATGAEAAAQGAEDIAAAAGTATTALGGLAAGAGRAATGIGSLALGAVGGPVGAAVLGVAALAGGIAYFATRASAAEQATRNFGKALGDFGSAATASTDAARQLADAYVGIQSDKAAVGQARTNLETARAALASSDAAKGSAQYRQAVEQVAAALAQYHSAQRQVSDGLSRVSALEAQNAGNAAALAAAYTRITATSDGLTRSIQHQYDVYKIIGPGSRGAIENAANSEATRANVQAHGAEIAQKYAAALQNQADGYKTSQPLLAHNIELLSRYAATVGKIPTHAQTRVVLENQAFDETLKQIIQKLQRFPATADPIAAADGAQIGKSFATGFATGAAGALPEPIGLKHILDFGKPSDAAAAIDQAKTVSAKVRAEIARALSPPAIPQTNAQIAKQFEVTPEQVAAIRASLDKVHTVISQSAASGQLIATARNDLQTAYLTAQQDTLNQAGDQITAWYDAQSAKLLDRTQALQRQQSLLSQKQAVLGVTQAKQTLQQDLLAQAQAQKSVSDLRQEVLLPGGRQLPANNQAALAQLQALERRTHSPALADFILQFRQALLGVQTGRTGIQAARLAIPQAKLGVEQGALGLQQQALDQQKAREERGLTLQQDQLKLQQDARSQRKDQLDEAKKQTALLKAIKAEEARRKFVLSLDRNPGGASKRQKGLAGAGR